MRRVRSHRSYACASDRKPPSFRSLFFPQVVFACLRQEPRQDLRPLSCPWPANASPESMSAIPRKVYQPIAIVAALGFVYFTVLAKLGSDWWHDENYSHGLLIPFVIAFILWQERNPFADLSAPT